MKAIPQQHDGILYRSRTEARWGEFWSLVGAHFEYEPEGFDLWGEWYVPDFHLSGVYVEVKPSGAPTARGEYLATMLAKETGAVVVIASGNPGSAVLRAHLPTGEKGLAHIVEEFKSETGAWLVQFTDGGGWSIPLCKGLTNCSAEGVEHPLLAVAGRLQFRVPEQIQSHSASFEPLGSVLDRVMQAVRASKPKGDA